MHHHFTLSAQYAADVFPFAMFFAWRALKDARFALSAADSLLRGGFVLAPCIPKRMSFGLPLILITTACDLPLEWLGVRIGLS